MNFIRQLWRWWFAELDTCWKCGKSHAPGGRKSFYRCNFCDTFTFPARAVKDE